MRAKEPWYDWPWPKIAKEVIASAGGQCQVRGPKCRKIATQCDHIIPPTQGGAWFDKSNLRASCTTCNYSRIDRTGQDAWRRSTTKITLVIGPPFAGKAHRVESLKRPGDLVVDYDALADALGGSDPSLHDTILKARGSVLSDIKRAKTKAKHVWIISANPRAEELFPFHDRIVVDPGAETCRQNAEQRGKQDRTDLIGGWYRGRSGQTESKESKPSRDWLNAASE